MRKVLTSLLLLALWSVPVMAQPVFSPDSEGWQQIGADGPKSSSHGVPDDSVDRASHERHGGSLEGNAGVVRSEESEGTEESKSSLDRVRFSGQIFTRYGWNVTNTGATENFNSFALDRWYFTARTALSENLSFRGTTDILSPDPEGGVGGYTIIVKYAYLDWNIRSDLSLRAGVHQTGWENYMNGVWGYRGVTKTMAHYQGHLSTSDLGATLTYTLPSQFGSASVGVHNGGGYRSLETDQFKDVSGQVRLTPLAQTGGPLAPLTLSGHVYEGTHTDGRNRQRWGGLLAYAAEGYTVGLNYEARTDGSVDGDGVSTFGTLRLGSLPPIGDLSLLGMLNWYDPNTAQGDDRMLRGVAGIAVEPTSGLTVTLDYQQRRLQTRGFTRYDGGQTDTDASLFLHVILNY